MNEITICMFGAASGNTDDIYYREAAKLGEEIGSRGHTLVFGGGATGMMGACADGVLRAGGRLIAVFPDFMSKYQLLDHCSHKVIRTATMSERKEIMEDISNAYIVLPGGIGTMDEFFQILTLVSLGRKSGPIVIYNTAGYYDGLIRFLDDGIQKGFISSQVKDLIRVCTTPEQALDIIEYFS